MKRLFWSLLMLIAGAIGVWLFSRRRMDVLYGEVSRLREAERELAQLKAHQEKIRQHNEKRIAAHEEFYATLPIEEQIDVAMRRAEWRYDNPPDDFPLNDADDDKEGETS